MKTKDKEFYTIQEFADKIGVCYRTIYNGIKKGHIEAFRVGRGKGATYRIPHSEIQRLGIFNLDEVIARIVDIKMNEREKTIRRNDETIEHVNINNNSNQPI